MGREAACTARFAGKVGTGKALLETKELIFRGKGLRFTIPLDQIRSMKVGGGALELELPEGTAVLGLGAEAAAWAKRIANPPGRLQKLGCKPDMKAAPIGDVEATFLDELRAGGVQVLAGRLRAGMDLIFFAVESPGDLSRLVTLKKSLQPAGAIWVLRAKGPAAKVSESAVMAAGKAAGLVDTKVVAFSETHTAERLVIPVKDRG